MKLLKKLNSLSLKIKFVLLTSIITIISIFTTAIFIANISIESVQNEVTSKLIALRDVKKQQMEDYLSVVSQEISILEKLKEVQEAYSDLKNYHDKMHTTENGNFNISTAEFNQITSKHSSYFDEYLKNLQFDEIKFICAAHGHVMYSQKKNKDLGENLRFGKFKNSALAKLWKKVVATKEIHFSDIVKYEGNDGEPTFFVAAPFFVNGIMMGVVVLEIPINNIDKIMNVSLGMGKTGETIIVGEDGYFRTNSRLSNQPTVLVTEDKSGVYNLTKEDKTGILNYICNHKKEAVGAYTPLKISDDFQWTIFANVHEEEAYIGKQLVLNTTIVVSIILLILSVALSFYISNYFVNPIKQIVNIMSILANGDLTQKSEIKSDDELGILRDAVNSFIDSLRNIVQNVKQAEETLSNAASQLAEASDNVASSVTEVSGEITSVASATEQLSANINNISATAEEMSVNAKNVARNSEKLEETTSSVASAVEEMSISIDRVSKNADEESKIAKNASEMSNNATITMKNLGIAANEIGKVTEVIKRIAEQTNLLALNATIEAASAGDAGKGFAVVANEIKELANQSAKAAEDIASRITGVQKNTSDAINIISGVSKIIQTLNEFSEITQKSLEQQSQAINDIASVTNETQQATKSIKSNIAEVAVGSEDLAKNTAESATGANQISASIHSIDETTNNISATSEEVNISANHLKIIANELKEIINQFKI